MSLIPYVAVTVARGPTTSLTVGRGPSATFTTYGHPGVTYDHVLLAEDDTAILTETGDLLLTA